MNLNIIPAKFGPGRETRGVFISDKSPEEVSRLLTVVDEIESYHDGDIKNVFRELENQYGIIYRELRDEDSVLVSLD